MRKLTIAEMREREARNASKKYGIQYNEIKTMMNRYYRLCGAYERFLYLENDERTCDRRSTLELSERLNDRFFKLNDDFKKCGLEMIFLDIFRPSAKLKQPQLLYNVFSMNKKSPSGLFCNASVGGLNSVERQRAERGNGGKEI